MSASLRRLWQWFSRQIDEIRSDRVLTLYGLALAAANVLTFIHWQVQARIPLVIGREAAAFCWPFWESCHAFRISASGVETVLLVYLFLSLLAGFCFASKEVSTGYWTLLLVNLIRLLIMSEDFRLRANQHYMLSWVVLGFLFVPGKRVLLQHLLVSFYFWAGVLKLDWEWLSGVALYNRDRLWVPEALVPASCVYVVILETLLIFGLYSRRNRLFYATFAQLILFHIFSWPVVGFWYPTLMLCLLSIVAMSRLLHPPDGWVTLPWTPSGRQHLLHAGVLGAFAFLQFVPHLFPGDPVLTGEGRLFALHMFDARVVCEANTTQHLRDGTLRENPLQTDRLAQRVRCDPIIFFDLAKNGCRQIELSRRNPESEEIQQSRQYADVVDFDLSVKSRRSSDPQYHQIIDLRNFCATNPTYDMWRHNAWILK